MKFSEQRRNALKTGARGLAALVGIKHFLKDKSADILEDFSSTSKRETFKDYPSMVIPGSPNTKISFVGIQHYKPNLEIYAEQTVGAIAAADMVMGEYNVDTVVLRSLIKRYGGLKNLTPRQFLRILSQIKNPTENVYFEIVKLLSYINKKPFITTDPDTYRSHAGTEVSFKRGFIPELRNNIGNTEINNPFFTYMVASIAETCRIFDKDLAAKIDKVTSLTALFDLLLTDEMQSSSNKILSGFILPRENLMETYGATFTEVSFINFRDFVSAYNLLLLIEKDPEFFRNKNIVAFYGSAHFSILQILKLPRWMIEMKINFYKKMLPNFSSAAIGTVLLPDNKTESGFTTLLQSKI